MTILVLGWSASAYCQSATNVAESQKATLPPGPMIKSRAPDYSRWVMETRVGSRLEKKTAEGTGEQSATGGGKTGETPAPNPTTTVTKTGKIYHLQLLDPLQSWSIWTDGSVVAMEATADGPAMFVAPPVNKDSSNGFYRNFSKSDFEGFEWLRPDKYKETKKMGMRDCLVFEEGATEGGTSGRVAVIDDATRLPVSLEEGGIVTTYTFDPTPPTSMQSLPASILAIIAERKKLNESYTRKPGTPY